jgi:hypothetical protein
MSTRAVAYASRHLAFAVTLFLAIGVSSVGLSKPASAAEPGPQWDSPISGNYVQYFGGDLKFKVRPVSGAVGYLFGFDMNGKPVWENYANERQLSSTEYSLKYGSPGWFALGNPANAYIGTWQLHVGARAYINDGSGQYHWSEQSDLNVTVQGFDFSNLLRTPDVSMGDIQQALRCGMSVATELKLAKKALEDLKNLSDAI